MLEFSFPHGMIKSDYQSQYLTNSWVLAVPLWRVFEWSVCTNVLPSVSSGQLSFRVIAGADASTVHAAPDPLKMQFSEMTVNVHTPCFSEDASFTEHWLLISYKEIPGFDTFYIWNIG